MSTAQLVSWLQHQFGVYLHAANWSTAAGIYIFTGRNNLNQWVPLYIGQTDSFQSRIPSHEQWNPARNLGASHVHVMVVPQKAQRDAIEAQLIQHFQPRLNTQLR